VGKATTGGKEKQTDYDRTKQNKKGTMVQNEKITM
jgi:hypothetical protein